METEVKSEKWVGFAWCEDDVFLRASDHVLQDYAVFLSRGSRVPDAGGARILVAWVTGLVGKAKAVSSRLTWTAWVQFPPFPLHNLPALLMSSIN